MNQGAILNQYYSKDLVDSLTKLIGKETGTIVMHSSLLGLGFPREGLDYFADYLINKLVYKLGYRLIIPVFTFDSEKKWSPLSSATHCGALSACLLKKYTSYRTIHPIHSVLDICSNNLYSFAGTISKTSFGVDTVWEDILQDNKTINIGIGIGLDGGGTFLHAIEQRIKINYRKFITLDKTVEINGRTINDFKYFARLKSGTTEIVNNWEKVRLDLLEHGLYEELKKPFFISISKPADVFLYLKSKLEKDPDWFISS